ncbi:hypothetical protein TrRE_jg13437, partial [Triparma retinervis]
MLTALTSTCTVCKVGFIKTVSSNDSKRVNKCHWCGIMVHQGCRGRLREKCCGKGGEGVDREEEESELDENEVDENEVEENEVEENKVEENEVEENEVEESEVEENEAGENKVEENEVEKDEKGEVDKVNENYEDDINDKIKDGGNHIDNDDGDIAHNDDGEKTKDNPSSAQMSEVSETSPSPPSPSSPSTTTHTPTPPPQPSIFDSLRSYGFALSKAMNESKVNFGSSREEAQGEEMERTKSESISVLNASEDIESILNAREEDDGLEGKITSVPLGEGGAPSPSKTRASSQAVGPAVLSGTHRTIDAGRRASTVVSTTLTLPFKVTRAYVLGTIVGGVAGLLISGPAGIVIGGKIGQTVPDNWKGLVERWRREWRRSKPGVIQSFFNKEQPTGDEDILGITEGEAGGLAGKCMLLVSRTLKDEETESGFLYSRSVKEYRARWERRGARPELAGEVDESNTPVSDC